MPRLGPIKINREGFNRKLRLLGFEGPFPAKRHHTGRAGSETNQKSLAGTVLKLSTVKSTIEMSVRLQSRDIATVTLVASTPVYMPSGRASLSDLQPDDHVLVSARPDPQRAFVYAASWVKDMDLEPIKNQNGVIFSMGQEAAGDIKVAKEGRAHTMLFGKVTRLVDVDRDTRIMLKNGKRGSLSDLQPGVHVQLTGLRISGSTRLRAPPPSASCRPRGRDVVETIETLKK